MPRDTVPVDSREGRALEPFRATVVSSDVVTKSEFRRAEERAAWAQFGTIGFDAYRQWVLEQEKVQAAAYLRLDTAV